MTQNPVVGEALQVFEKKARYRETEKNSNYELVMKYLISHFFPPKAPQRQKRYLRRGLYKPRDTKILYFICRIGNMVEYLDNFPPFGVVQCLQYEEILELVDLSLPK